ncbi:MAG: outer membrane beta-barrel protein [Bacteroidetes bacterium]|nr:outer membrane beta-barrel protein [Bacteroidota bacterium]
MKKYLFVSLLVISVLFSNSVLAQSSNSLEFSGGIVLPGSSSNGLNAHIQYNYQFTDDIQFYFYTGYSSWDKFYVTFREDWSEKQNETLFRAASSDDHTLIPLYIGSRVNVHESSLFNFFITLEAGYSHLSFSSYEVNKVVDPVSGVVTAYEADTNTKVEVTENLIGIGAGAGLSCRITENLTLVFSYKINNHINSKHYDIFSSKATYSAFTLGVNFKL